MPADARALYAALQATWPAAETRTVGPWTIRRGEDGGSRTEAASLQGSPEAGVAGLDAAEAAMRAWGKRPLFVLRPGEEALDAALAARGYGVPDRNLILAAPAAALAAPGGLSAIPSEAPLAVMEEIWAAGGIGTAKLAVMARTPPPRVSFLGRLGDRPAAAAFVAAHGGIAMLSALEVAPFARRCGLGARMVRAAAAWAAAQGAETLALAVRGENAPALALYARLGMAEAGRYHYREAPARGRRRDGQGAAHACEGGQVIDL
jgi:ribosomal protein S18 acetylase RimI-like enzyme